MNIHELAEAGDLAGLRAALDAGADVEARDAEGRSALMVAAISPNAGVDALQLLLDHGANVNALTGPKPALLLDPTTQKVLAEAGADPALFEQVAQSGAGKSVLSCALENGASLDKVRLLIAAGADVRARDTHGYSSLVRAMYAAFVWPIGDACALLDLLIEAGAPLDASSGYGESPVSVASTHGSFEVLNHLLARGADSSLLGWTPLCFAIAAGDIKEVVRLVEAGEPLESRDHRQRTPFLLAVQAGHVPIAKLLVARGCDPTAVAHCEQTALSLALMRDQVEMLRWLISQGADVEQANEMDATPLMEAAQYGAVRCVQALLEAGAVRDRATEYGSNAINSTNSPEVVRALVRAGEPWSDVPSEMRAKLFRYPANASAVTNQVFARHRYRTFGKRNPERMNNPVWDWQVAGRESAYELVTHFKAARDYSHPSWCFRRYGQSLTELPDGRFVEIAGEHEDYYDPDFCIYNDVVVHDRGTFTIYGYPEKIFPPTDFHSATLVGQHIYLIGNLGYTDKRRPGETPVFRLKCDTWSIEPVKCRGAAPGWIFKHRARLMDNQIVITGGEIQVKRGGDSVPNDAEFVLDLSKLIWSRR